MSSVKHDSLSKLILDGRKLLALDREEPARAYDWFVLWDRSMAIWIKDNMGANHLAAWSAVKRPVQVSPATAHYNERGVIKSIESAAQVRMDWLSRHAVVSQSVANVQIIPSTVFIVHGHDERMREMTARYIERFKLKVVILHEQPNKGRTIIEKFTDHADVGFAVVLLTGDDRGGLHDEPYENQQPRARQNVLFELGFFLGLIGRQRVCALYEQGVEIPSDYQGVIFIEADVGGAWKLQLAKEMKEAGLPVDLNDAV